MVIGAALTAAGCTLPIPMSPPDMAREIGGKLEAIRGQKLTTPLVVEEITPEQFAALEREELAKDLTGEASDREMAGLKVIGLLPAGVDMMKEMDLFSDNVLGAYDPEKKRVMLIRGRSPGISFIGRYVLAHELGHAMDDQRVDLDALDKKYSHASQDMQRVIHAIIEGSAQQQANLYLAKHEMFNALVELPVLLPLGIAQLIGESGNASTPYLASHMEGYGIGQEFMERGVSARSGKNDGKLKYDATLLTDLLRDPPRSMEQMIHPEKYWDPAKKDDPLPIDEPQIETLLKKQGLCVVRKDTMGELMCAILSSPASRYGDQLRDATTEAAAGWGNDRFLLVSDVAEDGKPVKDRKTLRGIWVTVWDTPKDRAEFLAAYEKNAAVPHQTRVFGERTAVFYFGFDVAGIQTMTESLGKALNP